MTKKQLKALDAFKEELLKVEGDLANLYAEGDNAASAVEDELRETFDAMSEKTQEGDKGQANEEARDKLDELQTILEQAKDSLNEALDALTSLVEG